MSILWSTWVSAFAAFFLATLACGVLSRRGFLPLHISALVGIGSYVFGALSGSTGEHPFLGAACALMVTSLTAMVFGFLFLRTRAAAAALISIAIQFVFDQYFRTATWTGGSSGLSPGISDVSPAGKMLVSAGLVLTGAALFFVFQRTAAARLLTLDGQDPLLSNSIRTIDMKVPLLVANLLVGLFAACAGLIITLQIGFLSPSRFSLNSSLLYASVILLVGYSHAGSIALGSVILALLPEALRAIGLGTASSSAWRGVIVGVVVLGVVLLQAPRPFPGRGLKQEVKG
jgi:branched-chain amino acid transport system permease protein